MEPVTLARLAMGTRFEIVLPGNQSASLRAAGEQALEEIEKLEKQLSLFDPSSEISYLNAYAADRAVQTEPGLFALLVQARDLWKLTGGAFDITVGPLLEAWGFRGGLGKEPSESELQRARSVVGMELVELDPAAGTVHFQKKGVRIDLGAIGKGYALERAVESLREAGVEHALLHGGTSTVCALGHGPRGDPWQIGIETPPEPGSALLDGAKPAEPPLLTVVPLLNESLSVSAVWGRFFERNGRLFGHVMDPREGRPGGEGLLAAVVLPSATETDALSTGLLIAGRRFQDKLSQERSEVRSLFVERDPAGSWRAEARGFVITKENGIPKTAPSRRLRPGLGQS